MEITPDSELLTLLEAAQMLRLKVSTLRAWRLKKRIPFIKFCRNVYVRRSDCLALINSGVVPVNHPQSASPSIQ